MNVLSIGSYRSKNTGSTVFRYKVTGTKAQLEAYKEAQKEHYRTDEKSGAPLWFSTRFIGQTGKLIITSQGNVIADMSSYEQAKSLSEQFGGDFGAEIAKAAAQAIMFGGNQASAPSQAPQAPSKEVAPEESDESAE